MSVRGGVDLLLIVNARHVMKSGKTAIICFTFGSSYFAALRFERTLGTMEMNERQRQRLIRKEEFRAVGEACASVFSALLRSDVSDRTLQQLWTNCKHCQKAMLGVRVLGISAEGTNVIMAYVRGRGVGRHRLVQDDERKGKHRQWRRSEESV